jgi:hypothetical protein
VVRYLVEVDAGAVVDAHRAPASDEWPRVHVTLDGLCIDLAAPAADALADALIGALIGGDDA